MEKDSAWRISNSKQVFTHLNQLFKNKCLLSAHFGDNDDSFITTVLELDPKKNQLVLDYGPKEYLNKLLLQSGKVEFRTEFEGIKVAFKATKIHKVRSKGQTVFTMPIPDAILWLQRRKFYRVKIPFAHNSYCDIKIATAEEDAEQTVQFKLFNISISGFCFLNDRPDLSDDLVPTNEFTDCTLHLNGTDSETVSFVIKNKLSLNPDKPDKGQRIGCAFSKITVAGESHIQRYMQNIERELKNIL